jgi:hypothetical protein
VLNIQRDQVPVNLANRLLMLCAIGNHNTHFVQACAWRVPTWTGSVCRALLLRRLFNLKHRHGTFNHLLTLYKMLQHVDHLPYRQTAEALICKM